MPVQQITPPFSFSVAPKVRSGTFSTPVFQCTAPVTTFYWELNIPNTADYENTSLSVTSQLFVNGVDASIGWQGGRDVNKQGVVDFPPPMEYENPAGWPAGTQFQLVCTVPTAFDVGIQNGLIS